jgi:hypothetical protein
MCLEGHLHNETKPVYAVQQPPTLYSTGSVVAQDTVIAMSEDSTMGVSNKN